VPRSLWGAPWSIVAFVVLNLQIPVAVAAYAAWIPAVADNSHPVLAALAGIVGWGALLTCAGLVVAVLRRRSSGSRWHATPTARLRGW